MKTLSLPLRALRLAAITLVFIPLSATAQIPLAQQSSTFGGASPTWPTQDKTTPTLATQLFAANTQFLGGWTATVAGSSDLFTLGSGAFLKLILPNGSIVNTSTGTGYTVTADQTTVAGENLVRRHLNYWVGPHAEQREITVTEDFYEPHGGCARVDVYCSEPYIDTVSFGTIASRARQQPVAVPYLGQINRVPADGVYCNVIIDHTLSQAAVISGDCARYVPLDNGVRQPVHETAYFAVSPNIQAVMPTAPNPPSPYRYQLANKTVLDVWSDTFPNNSNYLNTLASYGMTKLASIAEVWQNAGYDNALPDTLSANAVLGGDVGLANWASTATGLGEFFGVHENYCDFYTDASDFTFDDVSHDNTDKPIKSWVNSLGVQSYAMAPDATSKYEEKYSPQIESRYGVNAGYLDCVSAAPPWYHQDYRAGKRGSGLISTVFNADKAEFQFLRDTYKGPVFGEGGEQRYWTGLVDSTMGDLKIGANVSTQPYVKAQATPLFVDFDLLKIHPLSVTSGMGMLTDWPNNGIIYSASNLPDPRVTDQYRMQEIAFGHLGIIGEPLTHILPFAWQEYNLVSPVASREATAQANRIQYDVAGTLLDTNDAISAQGDTNFDRTRVTYVNGLTVYANGAPTVWTVRTAAGSTLDLPQYGWFAQDDNVTAYTALVDGVTADYAQTKESLFVDARTALQANTNTGITAAISSFSQTGPRQFTAAITWNTSETPVPAGYVPFVHVVDPQTGTIAFLIDQASLGGASTWTLGQPVVQTPVSVDLPAGLADGIYDIRAGLWNPLTGTCLPIDGTGDGSDQHRAIIGRLQVSNSGTVLSDDPQIDFGNVQTDGSFEMNREAAGYWSLIPFPRTQPIQVSLNAPNIDPAWQTLHMVAFDVNNVSLGDVPCTQMANGEWQFTLNTVRHATHYLLTP